MVVVIFISLVTCKKKKDILSPPPSKHSAPFSLWCLFIRFVFVSSLSFAPAFQFLLLLGCFALFWSLYYTLEVVLAHTDTRLPQCVRKQLGERLARRGRSGRGAEEALLGDEYRKEEEEQDSGVELHAVVDSEAKEKRVNGKVLEI